MERHDIPDVTERVILVGIVSRVVSELSWLSEFSKEGIETSLKEIEETIAYIRMKHVK